MTQISKNDKNGKVANNKNAASDLQQATTDVKAIANRFDEIAFQLYNYDIKYDPKYNPSNDPKKVYADADRFTKTATSKDGHKAYCNAVRGIAGAYANGKASRYPFDTHTGIKHLIIALNAGMSIHYCITQKSTQSKDVEYADGCFGDYDSFTKNQSGEKVQLPNAATLEQLLALPTIQKYCNFYQASFSGLPNCHFHVTYSRRCNYQEHQIVLTLLTIKLNEELPENVHKGFDASLETNSTHLCYAGKTPCVTLDRIPGLDNEWGLLIPVDEWLKEAKSRGIDFNQSHLSKAASKQKPTASSNNDESPLEYLERVIGKEKYNGDWSLWFSKHPKYPGGSWVTGSRNSEHLEGYNVFSSTDSSGTSFYATKKHDNLPPQWAISGIVEGHDKKGGSVVDYEYLTGRTEGKYQKGGLKANFKACCNAICDRENVPHYNWNKQPEGDEDNRTRLEILRDNILKVYPIESIRFNEMLHKVELDGDAVDFDVIRCQLDLNHQIVGTDNNIKAVLLTLAYQNRYHPVINYLETLRQIYPNNTQDLQQTLLTMSSKYLGTTEHIYNVYLKKHMIAAVRRVFKPGEMVKSIVVLQSQKQNMGKSTFVKSLCFDSGWFSDNLDPSNGKDKDTKASINKFLFHEIGEIDQFFKRSDRSSVKQFISSISDDYRAPYGRDIQSHFRRSVFWGTTNEQEILSDPTGSVRFWCIPVKQKIDFKLVEQDRDILWAAAYHAYLEGEQHWLTDEEDLLQESSNQPFTKVDPWEDSIMPFISHFDSIDIKSIYPLLGVEVKDQNKMNSNRIIDILKQNGWVYDSKKVKVLSQTVRLYHNPNKENKKEFKEVLANLKNGENGYRDFINRTLGHF